MEILRERERVDNDDDNNNCNSIVRFGYANSILFHSVAVIVRYLKR